MAVLEVEQEAARFDVPKLSDRAHKVVRQRVKHQPAGVGVELPRRAVRQPEPSFRARIASSMTA